MDNVFANRPIQWDTNTNNVVSDGPIDDSDSDGEGVEQIASARMKRIASSSYVVDTRDSKRRRETSISWLLDSNSRLLDGLKAYLGAPSSELDDVKKMRTLIATFSIGSSYSTPIREYEELERNLKFLWDQIYPICFITGRPQQSTKLQASGKFDSIQRSNKPNYIKREVSRDSVLSGVHDCFGKHDEVLRKSHKDDPTQTQSVEIRSRLRQLISSYLKMLGGLLSINPQNPNDIEKVKRQIDYLVRCANGNATEEPTQHDIERIIRGTFSSLCNNNDDSSKVEGQKPWWQSDSEDDNDDADDFGWETNRSSVSKPTLPYYPERVDSNTKSSSLRSLERLADTASAAYDADSESDIE